MSVATIATIFFVTTLCSAVSYFAAVPLAKRFGLVNTMVFTHLPSNVFLVLTAFAPTIWIAFALLILRGLLSQMDVPTRSSYVMAVVRPENGLLRRVSRPSRAASPPPWRHSSRGGCWP